MDYKKISNELLFTYHKNIDFVYKVLGEFLYNTQNFSRKYSKLYKTSEGKVFVSWDKSNDWSLKLNESVSRSDIKLSIKESNEYQPVDAYPGDYVDFGPYGKLYICKDLGDRYWVTDEESDAGNPNAQGWYIDKDLARDIIYSADDFEEDDFNESLNDSRDYKMVEYTYDGDNVSDYLGHVRVRTNSNKVALRAAEKYAMSKHPEYNPRHFKIVDYNYTNVDVVDSDGDYLTTLESVDESKSIKEDIELDTIADYITDHYDFDDIDDKYSCINSIKDSFKNEKTISKEELEQFIGSHNGKDKVTEGIDGWDNRTGVIKRIDKYLYDNPEAIPPKGYIQPGSRAYDDAVSRYGDYVTTPFGNISTDDLMQYARDNKLLDESKYTSSLIGPDSLLMNAEEAYFDGNLGDFVADSLNDGSATEEELLAVTEKSSFIEYDDMLNAIDYAKSLSSF